MPYSDNETGTKRVKVMTSTTAIYQSKPLTLIRGWLPLPLIMLALLFAQVPQVQGSEATPGMAPMDQDQVQRGTLLLKQASGGVSMQAPTLKTDVKMNISGMLARVSVHQRFKNAGSE
jgi:hypothetical protein